MFQGGSKVNQVIGIGMGLTRVAVIHKSQQDVKYSYKNEGGRGVALSNAPSGVKCMT
jgi:hypothetical protein